MLYSVGVEREENFERIWVEGISMTMLESSPFSRYFTALKFMGAWVVERVDNRKLAVYVWYKVFMTLSSFFGVYVLLADFFSVLGNFKKITWNLCVTTLFIGELFKNFFVFHHNDIIEKLRIQLHKDQISRTEPEYQEIDNSAVNKMRSLEKFFYIGASLFVPMWLVVRYMTQFWGSREWPVPVRLPFELDVSNDTTYILGFFLLGSGSILGIILSLQTELAMFSLLIQISREYMVLLKDIPKVNDLLKEVEDGTEINPLLLRKQTKLMLKNFSTRQQEILMYIKDFETCYNKPLLLHLLGVSVLMIVSAVQCMVESNNDPANLSYQLGYICILLFDVFLVCWFGTQLNNYCLDVGRETYSVSWYKMNPEALIYVNMIIMRSQNPPKITSGKFMEMNVHTFIILLRNIYSWLTLFQQLAFKDSN